MKRFGNVSGFTLLELLIAVTLTLVLAGIMIGLTANVLSLWQRTQNAQTQTTTAMLALDAIERDLQTAWRQRDGTPALAVDIIDSAGGLANHGWLLPPGIHKPANGASLRPLPPFSVTGVREISDARFGLSGAWLRFIATNVESDGSVPCLIAYKLARRPVVGDASPTNVAPIRYGLYRAAVTATETFSRGYDVTSTNYASGSNAVTDVSTATHRAASTVMNPSHANLIASNVVDFGCWLYERATDGTLMRLFPESEADVSHVATGDSRTPATRYPDVVDVFIRVLSEEGATSLDLIETGRRMRPSRFSNDAEWWWAEVEANSRVFVRRIEIKGGTL